MIILAALLLLIGLSAGVPDNRVVSASEVRATIKAGDPADFDNYIVKGDLDLSGMKIEDEIHFNHTSFRGSANFASTTFNGDANFNGAVFIGTADFGDAIFCRYADFRKTEFEGEAYFWDAIFNGTAYSVDKDLSYDATNGFVIITFDGTNRDTFPNGDVDFSGANFKRDSWFSNADFNGTANFRDVVFSGETNFYEADFNASTYFSNSSFNNNAEFENSTFEGIVYYQDANFKRYAWFSNADFNGSAEFEDATFDDAAWFLKADFRGNANFPDAIFDGRVSFRGTRFNITDFSATQFNEATQFDDSKFNGIASFNGSRFKGDALFENTTFHGELSLTKTRYDKLFIRWHNIKSGINYDDTAYLSLMKNFKDLGYYEDYDSCYFQYRKAHRGQPWPAVSGCEASIRKAIDYPMELFYGYGTKPFNAFSFSLVIVVVFALFWWALGLGGPKDRTQASLPPGEEWLDGDITDILGFSVTVFLSGTRFFIDPPALPRIEGRSRSMIKKAFILERLLGALFSILFFIAISGTIVRSS
ncbi:MAG: pentapeptide repeat-containing protein [Methanothrix sp.]|nr:pentapeptide repeat-containing protein [Methanothrix sp.]